MLENIASKTSEVWLEWSSESAEFLNYSKGLRRAGGWMWEAKEIKELTSQRCRRAILRKQKYRPLQCLHCNLLTVFMLFYKCVLVNTCVIKWVKYQSLNWNKCTWAGNSRFIREWISAQLLPPVILESPKTCCNKQEELKQNVSSLLKLLV